MHIENPPIRESQTTKSGGTEGRPTETVAVVPGGESTNCSTECCNNGMHASGIVVSNIWYLCSLGVIVVLL